MLKLRDFFYSDQHAKNSMH